MAAGRGERFGGRKQFFDFCSTTVAGASCDLFLNLEGLDKVFLVYPPDMKRGEVEKKAKLNSPVELVRGGDLREKSVEKGLDKVKSKYVLIHDAARPLCPLAVINNVVREMKKSGAAVPALRPSSALARASGSSFVPLDRNSVYLIQTPQGYKSAEIRAAYKNRKSRAYPDSSAVAYEQGIKVKPVEGDRLNVKITERADYEYLCSRKRK